MEAIIEAIRTRRLLLLLDNCEHLAGACCRLIDALLRDCPKLRLLATSREALNVEGQVLWPVPSLRTPAAGERSRADQEFDSVRLFAQRARAALASWRLTPENTAAVAEICRRLDGIPLAIELAAVRVRVLSPEEIAGRLGDRFHLLTAGSRTGQPRHQTLRALVDWSHDLLSPDERLLFRRLSVFAGGWTLPAAEDICSGAGIERRSVLTLLAALVDKSLVVVLFRGQETRYGTLETLRQYAAERLEESGETPYVRGRHLVWFRELTESMEAALQGPDQAPVFGRLETELGNLRTALEWSKTDPARLEDGLRLSGALMRFWYYRGHAVEGEIWLSELLALHPTPEDGEDSSPSSKSARATALMAAGFLTTLQRRSRESRVFAEKALVLWRELDDRPGIAFSLWELGQSARRDGELERAQAFLERASRRAIAWGAARS